MSQYKVHNIKFVDFQPKSINTIAYDDVFHKIAIGRDDSSIEIFNIKNNMSIDFIIPGNDGRSIEHLEWFKNGRLFSSGLTGEIIEWDLESLIPKYQQDSYGGPVWHFKFNNAETQLAAGCEDGSIRLFNVEDESIVYLRSLSVQAERILSLSWSFDDNCIVSGGYGSICVYNANNGQIISRMSPQKNKDKTVVWAVQYLKNDFIVVGDSLGNTQFWCSSSYTLLSSFKSHQADVLSIASTPDHQSVFSTGIDSNVAQFIYDENNSEFQWKMINHVKATDHDTRALVCCGNEEKPFIISGGIDPRFVTYPVENFSYSSYIKYSCLASNPCLCSLAGNANVIIFHDNHTVHGWKLGGLPDDDEKSVVNKYKKLFEISSKDRHHITCSAISENATYVAHSTVNTTILFEISSQGNNYALHKIESRLPPTRRICFWNNELLIGAGFDKTLILYNIKTSKQFSISFDNPSEVTLPFAHLCVSKDGNYAAISGADQKVFIFNLKKYAQLYALPKVQGNITDIKFHPESNNIFIITSSRHFYEFDINEFKLLNWADQVSKKKVFKSLGREKHHIMNLAVNPKSVDEIFLQTKNSFGKLKYNYNIDDIKNYDDGESKRKRAKLTESIFNVNRIYHDTMFFDFNSDGDIVLAKHNLTKTIQNLPEPLKLKKFGE